ncbi:MAG: type I-B CRISPR-associated protein Cas7/Cst2/DevR [Candidatus Aenigmatarchaeota archaeon]
MVKVVQISILGKISGNVNADEVIGTRITLKKMYSSGGEVLPFVSARAVKFAIRKALYERGFKVDPFNINPNAEESLRLSDSAKPHEYIDNDLFGYMVTLGGEGALKRQAPIALSYFKALKDTPIKTEFAARFPRPWGENENPAPFEIEVAEFIGKINCIMYDYIGDFTIDKKIAKKYEKKSNEAKQFLNTVPDRLSDEERKKRIRAFCEVFLTPTYVLPRATNSLNIPEYIAGLVVLSEKGPLPVYQYLNYDFELNTVDVKSLETMMKREEIKNSGAKIMLIDYVDKINTIPDGIEKVSVSEAINEITQFL